MPPATLSDHRLPMYGGSSPDRKQRVSALENRDGRRGGSASQVKTLECVKETTDNSNQKNDIPHEDRRCVAKISHVKNLECVNVTTNKKPDISSENKDYLYGKVTSETDFQVVLESFLSAQASCWYYGDCSSADAKIILKQQALGTFIMRNSSDPKYLFSLSVKTERGPTSVRIRYSRGLFQMDCEDHLKNKLPKFDNVVGLISFHVDLSKSKYFSECRWLEKSGRRDMAVNLRQPKRSSVPSLQHLCRLTVNSTMKDRHLPAVSSEKLPLPRSIKTYLQDYPYTV